MVLSDSISPWGWSLSLSVCIFASESSKTGSLQETSGWTDGWTDGPTDRQADRYRQIQTDTDRYRQIQTDTDRQTDPQTHTHTHIHTSNTHTPLFFIFIDSGNI